MAFIASQTNTLVGDKPCTAAEDLSDKEGYLAVVKNSSGACVTGLPAAITDLAFYLIVDGVASGKSATLRPLEPGREVRVKLKSTCVSGDQLVLADTGTAADKGKVRKLPATSGTYRVLLIAEESGVDGQFVKCRYAPVGNVVVP